jgi:hypothetical protein
MAIFHFFSKYAEFHTQRHFWIFDFIRRIFFLKEKYVIPWRRIQWTIFHEPNLSERFVRIGKCVRITFGTKVKIAGKYDFFKFCKPYISSRSHPTQEIFYIQTLGGCLYKLTKFERIPGGGTPPPPLSQSKKHIMRWKIKCSINYSKFSSKNIIHFCSIDNSLIFI